MTSPPHAPAPKPVYGGTLFKFGVLPYKSRSTLEDEVGGRPSQETDSRGGSLIFSPDNPLVIKVRPPGRGWNSQ